MSERRQVTVVVGRLDILVAGGLGVLLGRDARVSVVASELEPKWLEEAVAEHTPDVVIVDETVEYTLLRKLRSDCGASRIVVFVREASCLYATMLVAAGVRYLVPTASKEEILAALGVSDERLAMFVGGGSPHHNGDRGATGLLTRREAMVFEHLRSGRSYAEIADALHIAPETARTHTRSIRRKLDVASKRGLIGHELDGGRNGP